MHAPMLGRYTKITNTADKCICSRLNLNVRANITTLNEFEKINWLPINDCFEQCSNAKTFNVFNNSSPAYMNFVFKPTGHPSTNTRPSFLKLNQPLRKTNHR